MNRAVITAANAWEARPRIGVTLCLSLAWLAAGAASAGVMLGAHVGSENAPDSQAQFVGLETAIGRKLAIDNDMEDWAVFPDAERVRWDQRNGRLPMLSWRIIFHRNNPAGGCATADSIVAGTWDGQLARQATAVKALGGPVLVRFNYEMTNNEENSCFTGFAVKQNIGAAGQKYIAAWRHIVDKFRAAGATNVAWVWAPGHKAYSKGQWRNFYPGSRYVDWVGVDDYNKTDQPMSFASEPGMLAFYAAGSSLGKPLMVAETGAVDDPSQRPDPQTVWLTTARQFLVAHPAIKAFVYWNNPGKFSHLNPGYGGTGYALSGAGLAAFKAMADDPRFR